jgi:hypothetical protein
MGVVHMGTYRATCDEPGCKNHIDVVSEMDAEAIATELRFNEWWVSSDYSHRNPPSQVNCPVHTPEKQRHGDVC